MPQNKLPHYIRRYRKRSYLSQKEVAFLLGCNDSAKVSKYERFLRWPRSDTMLAYEIIFRVPMRQLFAGMYHKVEQEVSRRARLLVRKTLAAKPDASTSRKLQALRAISGPKTASTRKNS